MKRAYPTFIAECLLIQPIRQRNVPAHGFIIHTSPIHHKVHIHHSQNSAGVKRAYPTFIAECGADYLVYVPDLDIFTEGHGLEDESGIFQLFY